MPLRLLSLARLPPRLRFVAGGVPWRAVRFLRGATRRLSGTLGLDVVTATRIEGRGAVTFEMPELGATLTPGEAERLGQALLLAVKRLRETG